MPRETGLVVATATSRVLARGVLLVGLVFVLWLLAGSGQADADEKTPGATDVGERSAEAVAKTTADVGRAVERTAAAVDDPARRTTEEVRALPQAADETVRDVVGATDPVVDAVVDPLVETVRSVAGRPGADEAAARADPRKQPRSSSRQGDSTTVTSAQRAEHVASRLESLAPVHAGATMTVIVEADGASVAEPTDPTPTPAPTGPPAPGCSSSPGVAGAAPHAAAALSVRRDALASAPVRSVSGDLEGFGPAPSLSPGCTPD